MLSVSVEANVMVWVRVTVRVSRISRYGRRISLGLVYG